MNTKILVTGFLALGLLAGCGGNNLTTSSPGSNSTSDASQGVVDQPAAQQYASQKMLADLKADLQKSSVGVSGQGVQKLSAGLSSSQIATIISSAAMALNNAGLGQSNDLAAIIPALIQGASLGAGTLGSSNIASLISLIGNSTLNSLVNQSTGSVAQNLLQTVAQSVFANLSNAGISRSEEHTSELQSH